MDEHFKLMTRRVLGWTIAGIAIGTIAFTGIWGVLTGATELVTLSVGILGTTIGAIIAFYFGKKTSEE